MAWKLGLFLMCLLLVGCEGKQEIDQNITIDSSGYARVNLYRSESLDPNATAEGDTNYTNPSAISAMISLSKDLLALIDTTVLYRIEVKGFVDTLYQMPPGQWVQIFKPSVGHGLQTVYGFLWPSDLAQPDSVFILKDNN